MLYTLNIRPIVLLVLTLLTTSYSLSLSALQRRDLDCEPDISKYNDTYCNSQGNITGCYPLGYNALYGSCASICTEPEYEDKCSDWCAVYHIFVERCVESTTITKTTTEPTSEPNITTSSTTTEAQTDDCSTGFSANKPSNKSKTTEIALGVTVGVLLIVVLIGATYIFGERIRQRCCPTNNNRQRNPDLNAGDGTAIPLTVT